MKCFVSLVAVACLLQQSKAEFSNQVVKASNTFANKLYEKVAKTPGNVLVCPLSLHVALGLVLQGAGSNTSTELASVLGFGELNDGIKDSYKNLLTGIKDNTLKIATKLYPASNYQLSRSYVSAAQQYFLSDVEGVDYSKPAEASSKINKYVEEHTNNKIHDLISPDSISDLTRLIIINAVHFQATWKKTFTTAYDDYFKVSPTEKVLIKMMSMTDYFHYKDDSALDAKVLKMDYTDGGYSMLFVLPNKEDGLAALEEKLARTDLEKLLSNLKETKVEVTIPKFKLEKTINLKDVLINMGIKDMFSSRADLHGIASGDSLYVSDVIQKTFINVHENGTEAAAATGFLLELLSANTDSVMFYARRPFHFALVRSHRPRVTLFEGRFVQPSPDRNYQESNQFSQQGDLNEEAQEKDKTTINSGHKTDQQFKPDLLNNKKIASWNPQQSHVPATNKQKTNNSYHQTQHATTQLDQSSTTESDITSPTYSGHESLHQPPYTKPQTQYAKTTFQTTGEESDIKYPEDDMEIPSYQTHKRPVNHNSHNLAQSTSTTTQQTENNGINNNHQNSHNSKPIHENSNDLTQTTAPTTQPNQLQTDNTGINHNLIEQKPHQNLLNSKPIHENSNNLTQTTTTTTENNQLQQTKNSGINHNLIRQKPHQNLLNSKPVPEMQHVTTQSGQSQAENSYEQSHSHSRPRPVHQTQTNKPVTENSNILAHTPNSYQLSAEDYIRLNNEFALQLQQYYRQQLRNPPAIPFQRVY